MDGQEMLSLLLRLARGLVIVAIAACLIMASFTACEVVYLVLRFVSTFVQQALFGYRG